MERLSGNSLYFSVKITILSQESENNLLQYRKGQYMVVHVLATSKSATFNLLNLPWKAQSPTLNA